MRPVAPGVEWVHDPGRFAELQTEWDALARIDGTPFSRHAWYSAWWQAFGAGRELHIAALWDHDGLAAAFPLCREHRRLEAMANVHTPSLRLPARDPAALERVARAAIAARGPAGERLELAVPAVPASHPLIDVLARGTRAAGRLTLVERQHTSPRVDTGGSWEEYRRTMRPKWESVARKRRKMRREHEVSMELMQCPRDLDGPLAAGLELERSGWKGRNGTAVLSSVPTRTFYLAVARAFHATKELSLSQLTIDGELAAFDLCLEVGGRLYLLKTGYDERRSVLAPGMVMRLSVVERCFELGLRSHELLGDEAGWKRRFATGEEEHRVVRVYPRRALPAARYGYRRAVRPVLRGAYRRLRELRSG
jgi:CelD/BcsL family acetyltransferase involved in cellulose biosynthesis